MTGMTGRRGVTVMDRVTRMTRTFLKSLALLTEKISEAVAK